MVTPKPNISQNANNVNTKTSITPTTDSEGNTLGKQQQEYFKDSKIRDENGNKYCVLREQNGSSDEDPTSRRNPYSEGASDFTISQTSEDANAKSSFAQNP